MNVALFGRKGKDMTPAALAAAVFAKIAATSPAAAAIIQHIVQYLPHTS